VSQIRKETQEGWWRRQRNSRTIAVAHRRAPFLWRGSRPRSICVLGLSGWECCCRRCFRRRPVAVFGAVQIFLAFLGNGVDGVPLLLVLVQNRGNLLNRETPFPCRFAQQHPTMKRRGSLRRWCSERWATFHEEVIAAAKIQHHANTRMALLPSPTSSSKHSSAEGAIGQMALWTIAHEKASPLRTWPTGESSESARPRLCWQSITGSNGLGQARRGPSYVTFWELPEDGLAQLQLNFEDSSAQTRTWTYDLHRNVRFDSPACCWIALCRESGSGQPRRRRFPWLPSSCTWTQPFAFPGRSKSEAQRKQQARARAGR